ncbi:response regulator [Xylophilus sp. GOD-11R]|uniref:response regulator n=1 Tax=Xylophilus sp. GOD-11R TaxID=3089814 RepID=UPI00298D49E4|nr:response regulator [Xylophilus sp. GOD-11R]WPB55424.1 response regulator [Xylophilus sp. GOD-11R]
MQGSVAVVIEDEAHIRQFVCAALEHEGWKVWPADSVQRGTVEAGTRQPQLILLDLGLPDGDGTEVIRSVRSWSDVPIIVLSARSDEDMKIRALDAGADDYLTKPFGVGELMARVRASQRKHRGAGASAEAADTPVRFGTVEVDRAARLVRKAGQEVHLTPREWNLLATLLAHAGRVMTHRQLLLAVWGPAAVEQSHYTRIYMGNLRRKLEDDPAQPRFLLTENAVGYRLVLG